jgi:hypothetical protein
MERKMRDAFTIVSAPLGYRALIGEWMKKAEMRWREVPVPAFVVDTLGYDPMSRGRDLTCKPVFLGHNMFVEEWLLITPDGIYIDGDNNVIEDVEKYKADIAERRKEKLEKERLKQL